MILFVVFGVLAYLAYAQSRKSNGTTQAGVDASVKGFVFAVLALVALMYLAGVA